MKTLAKNVAMFAGLLTTVIFVSHSFGPPKAQAQDPKQGTRIGLVDVKKAIAGYTATVESEKAIDSEREARLRLIDGLKKELDDLRSDLIMLMPDCKPYMVTLGKTKVLDAQIRAEEDELKSYVQFRLLEETRKIYARVAACCEELRVELGLDAIFKVEFTEVESESKAELVLRINSRGVLAWSRDLDLTDKVLDRLNREQKK